MRIFATLFLSAYFFTAIAQDDPYYRELHSNNFFRLRDLLAKTDTLPNDARLYYSTFVDNAFNRPELSIARADSFLAIKDDSWNEQHIMRLQEAQMDNYRKTFQYRKAADIAGILMEKYPPNARHAIDNMRQIMNALADTPPQTVTIGKGITVRMDANPLGLWELPVQAGGKQLDFIFDTGANLSTISQSNARKMGLKLKGVTIKVHSIVGRIVEADIGVADTLRIGNILVNNVVFLVFPDEMLHVGGINYDIQGIIGFPVISAMKEVRITRGGMFIIPAHPYTSPYQNLAINGYTPQVLATSGTDTLVFNFDSGAGQTDLYSNYYEAHKKEVKKNSRRRARLVGGVGGTEKHVVYELDNLTLRIGDDVARLQHVAVYREPVLRSGRELAVGNMGQDVIKQFNEMVLNFEDMFIDFR